ncbi:MAG: MarR family transcriptional regulator [Chitinophagales bacterium]|nr:MarR family transcriptional regulator [Chitinophagales bacterium]
MSNQDSILCHIEPKPEHFGRLVGITYRFMAEQLLEVVKEKGFPNFSMQYVAILMNVGAQGVTINQLAEKIQITKQAVSKMAKDLEKFGYVELKKNPNDNRSVLITLSKQGVALIELLKKQQTKFIGELIKTWGETKTHTFLEDMHFIMRLLIQKKQQKAK